MRLIVRFSAFVLLLAVVLVPVFGGGAPEAAEVREFQEQPHWTSQGFDLDALIAAAQEEGQLTVRWHSGRAPQAATAFEQEYGISVVASPRFDDSENVERLRREVAAGSVVVDVMGFNDGGLIIQELIPQGILTSWTPPDLQELIGAESKDPQVYLWQPTILGFNSQVHDESPIENLWELTEEQWRGRVVWVDPQIQSNAWHFFAGVVDNADVFAAAYERRYGRTLQTNEENAGWEWLRRMFENDVLNVEHDTEVARAIGAPGQTRPPVGFHTLTRWRDAREQNLNLGFDPNIEPFAGFAVPTYVVIPTAAPNPNAARLWVRWVLKEQGSFPWTDVVGGFSPNAHVDAHPDDPMGSWEAWTDVLLLFDPVRSAQLRQDLEDFFLIHSQ